MNVTRYMFGAADSPCIVGRSVAWHGNSRATFHCLTTHTFSPLHLRVKKTTRKKIEVSVYVSFFHSTTLFNRHSPSSEQPRPSNEESSDTPQPVLCFWHCLLASVRTGGLVIVNKRKKRKQPENKSGQSECPISPPVVFIHRNGQMHRKDLQNTLLDITHGMPTACAARKWGVPRTTLSSRKSHHHEPQQLAAGHLQKISPT